MKYHAQGSVEYLLLLGITIVIVLVVVGYVATFSHSMANTTARMDEKGIGSVMDKIRNVSSSGISG